MYFDLFLLGSFVFLVILIVLNKKFALKKGALLKKAFFVWSALAVLTALFGVLIFLHRLKLNLLFLLITVSILILFVLLDKKYHWGKKGLKRLMIGWLAAACLIVVMKMAFGVYQKNEAPPKNVEKAAKVVKKAPTEVEKTAADLTDKWEATLKGYPEQNVDIAFYSKKEDHTYTFNQQPQKAPFYTASIMKVSILTQLLHLEQTNQLEMTEEDKALAESMIEHSNNEAAHYFYKEKLKDYEGTKQLFKALKMQDSTPGSSSWGITTTTAADQILLLNDIFFFHKYLSAENADYLKNLMENIEPDQKWGISAASSEVQLKNGWLNADGTGWTVNSIGHLVISGEEYTMAILTNNDSTLEEGQQLIEQLAKDTQAVMTNQ